MVCVISFDRLKPFLIGLAILVVAVGVVLVLQAFKPKAQEEQAVAAPLMVRTAPVVLKQQKVASTFQGEVRAKTEIELVTQVSGKVVKVADNFIEGGQFEPGETLIQIDDADYLVALKLAQADVASAQVALDRELATAETNAKQWETLQKRPLSEASPLVLNKPQIDSAQARLSAARAQLDAAKLNYSRTKLSAPFAGRIMTKSAELGQFMPAGSSIGRVFASDAMEIRIPITDVELAELGLPMGYSANRAKASNVPAKVSARVGEHIKQWQGSVRSVDASVDSATRLVFATVVVDETVSNDDSPALLAPGLFVDVQLSSARELVGLEVPRNALRNGNQVFLMSNDTLLMKPVDVIYTSKDVAMVLAGNNASIEAGDLVIISPVPGAYSGMPVKLPPDSTAISPPDSDAEQTQG